MAKREEIDNKYKWNLSLIYKTTNDFDIEYKYVEKNLSKLSSYKNKLLKNANNLNEFLKLDEDLSRKIEKMYVYANMTFDSDTSNSKSQQLLGRIKKLYTSYSETISFVNPELLTKDYSLIESFYKELPELKRYEKTLKEIYRMKPHTLSKEEETILSAFGNILSNPEDTYSYLTDSDMKFGNIIDENGKEVELTESNYALFRVSKDRRVRKDSFTRLFKTYSNYKNTIASTYQGNVEALTKLASIRHFNSSIEASLFDEQIDISVYNNLIDTVSNHLDVLFDYFEIKRQALKLDKLHLYDTYANLIDKYEKKYTFEEAKELVINATKVFGPKYTEIINKAFDEHWIDIYPNEAKRGGAYSGGCYDTPPYLLLNYVGEYNDVSTLAHELGHSMHSYLTRTNNEYPTGDYKIFVAEVASTVNELLLAKYIINTTKDNNERLFILNNMLDLYKATIYRQVMFAEFEKITHQKYSEGITLTNEYLSDIYYELNKKYFGDKVEVDDEIRYEWMRIPHFYYNFYVYKYAIGLSCASKIVSNILSGKEGSVDNYIKFLSSGSTKPPMELLKDTDCDLTSSSVIESAIETFNDLLNEFIDTYNSVKEGEKNGKERLLRGTRGK